MTENEKHTCDRCGKEISTREIRHLGSRIVCPRCLGTVRDALGDNPDGILSAVSTLNVVNWLILIIAALVFAVTALSRNEAGWLSALGVIYFEAHIIVFLRVARAFLKVTLREA